MKKALAFLGVLLLGASVGAATGVTITATLKNQAISYNGALSSQQVVSYKGTTYVPLRSFSTLLDVPVDYKEGTIYLGANNTITAPVATTKDKFTFSINGASTGISSYDNKTVAIIDMSFTNNSGKSQSPGGTLFNVKAYQNGIQLEYGFDSDLTENDAYTSVMSGSTLNYGELFVLSGESPITIEVTEFMGDKKVSKTFDLN